MTSYEEARGLLAEILSRTEFSQTGPPLLQRLLDSLRDTLLDFAAGPGLIAAVALSLLVAAAFLALVFWMVRRYRPSLEKEGRLPVELADRPTPRSALERSRKEAGRGGYKEAIRYLLLAVLLQLGEEGALDFRLSRTNGELLRQLRERELPAYPLAAELVSLYEKLWYGRFICRREDYEHGLRLYARLQEARR